MAKKKSLNTMALVFIGVAVLGVILAVVGLFTPWLTCGENFAEGLFSEVLTDVQTTSDKFETGLFSINLIRPFGIICLVVAIIATALVALQALGIFKFEGLFKLVAAVVVIALGVVLLIFAISYVNSYNRLYSIDLPGDSFDAIYSLGIGAIFLPVGTIVSGAAYLLNK